MNSAAGSAGAESEETSSYVIYGMADVYTTTAEDDEYTARSIRHTAELPESQIIVYCITVDNGHHAVAPAVRPVRRYCYI